VEEAWASFRLFLRCVDKRFWLWMDQSVEDSNKKDGSDLRLIFLDDNEDTIKNNIRKNEQELEKTLFGVKKQERGIWPWIEN
jgi:hypothetical protein